MMSFVAPLLFPSRHPCRLGGVLPHRGDRPGGAADLFAHGPFSIVGMPLLPPGAPGLLAGSDVLGRDMAVGLAYGARISLLVGITSTICAVGIGVLLGAVAGYYGGVVDDLLMRITEFFQIIPSFVLLMVLVAFLQPSLGSTVIGIALITWPQVARVVRGEFLSLRSREFVEAARVLGMRDARIIFTQILPNALPPIVVISSMMVGNAILTESALSFLGPWRSQSVELGQHDRRFALGHVGGLVDHGAAGRLHHGDGAGAEFHRRRAERRPQSPAETLMPLVFHPESDRGPAAGRRPALGGGRCEP